jgi:RND family efflux transporter MFP subunit
MICKRIYIRLLMVVIIGVFVVAGFYSCSKKENSKQQATVVVPKTTPDQNEVDAIILQREPFKEELLSNGKLVARKKSVLKFEVEGTLKNIFAKEGSYVNKNTILAQLDAYTYQQNLENAEIGLKKAQLEFEDMLISREYDINKKEEIPKSVYEMMSLRSGYSEALQALKKAKRELAHTRLTAPFFGKVAAIQNKVHEHISANTVFLTLINDQYFEVEFYITESEIHKVKVNAPVTIFATGPQQEYKGKVTVINPIVEKNGTILIKASVKNDGQLLEGMNVKISIEKNIPNQFVIPKSAVLVRQDQQVLFKAIDGKAHWTYVQTTNENKNYYTVVSNRDRTDSRLNVGDTIITNGNLTLAHKSNVMIKKLQTNENPLGF